MKYVSCLFVVVLSFLMTNVSWAQRNPESGGLAFHIISLDSNQRIITPSLSIGVRKNFIGNRNFAIGIGSKIGVGYPVDKPGADAPFCLSLPTTLEMHIGNGATESSNALVGFWGGYGLGMSFLLIDDSKLYGKSAFTVGKIWNAGLNIQFGDVSGGLMVSSLEPLNERGTPVNTITILVNFPVN